MNSASLKISQFSPHIADIFDYADSVISGARPAGEWERRSVERFYRDIDHNKTYVFDDQKALRVIEFIELLPHVKGKWAAKREKIRLQPWQKFIVGNIFGWIHKKTRLRRFCKVYTKISRKNGKSVLAAAIGVYMLTAENEFGAEVYCGATTEKQAWEVFRPAKWMMEKSPALLRAFNVQVNAKTITGRNNSRFVPLIGKPGDGSSPSCAIVDEYHEHADSIMFDTMDTGMGAREQPLLLVITTAGTNIESPCHQFERDVERVLLGEKNGGVDNDEVFGIMYGIDKDDDWTTEEALIKANPNYGISVGADFLKAAQKYAIQNTSKQNSFKTKHLDVWCWARSAYFNAQKWLELGDSSLKMEDFQTEDCFVGLDLAKIHDLSSIVTVFRRYEGGQLHYYVFSKNYLPEETIRSDESPELTEKYTKWFIDGHLLPGGDTEMDLDIIVNEVISLQQSGYNILEVPHDPHLGFLIAKALAETGLVPVEIRQHGSYLSAPMREIEAAIAAGRIHHDNNPVTNWCIGNVLAKEFTNGGLMPTKENKSSKIDAASALIMAVGRGMLGEEDSIDSFLNNPISSAL